MDTELLELLARAKAITPTAEQVEESDIRMAVANGLISDDRITVEVMKAVETVNKASTKTVA